MGKRNELFVVYYFTAKRDDKGAATKSMDVRRGRAKPMYKILG